MVLAQEVLGPNRHPKFAHLPTLPRKAGRPGMAPPLPADAVPEPAVSASVRVAELPTGVGKELARRTSDQVVQ